MRQYLHVLKAIRCAYNLEALESIKRDKIVSFWVVLSERQKKLIQEEYERRRDEILSEKEIPEISYKPD